MASSNRHWPSLFKSKPTCNSSAHHQWHHDITHSSLLSSHCQKPSSFLSGGEERTPEPKPRWNPKPEQIRILEAIFNSGMVNPPREEIRRIRAQLQAYGQVGDANVFYWFQNRKSRSKHKQRHLKSAASRSSSALTPPPPPPPPPPPSPPPPPPLLPQNIKSVSTPPHPVSIFDYSDTSSPSLAIPPELSFDGSIFHPAVTSYSPEIWGDFLMEEIAARVEEGEIGGTFSKLEVIDALTSITDAALSSSSSSSSPFAIANMNASFTTLHSLNMIQEARSTVFINEVAYEVMAGPLNIREAFGGGAVLLHSSGHPVLTDQWGLTLHPLQHGASYYLVQ